jgi:outer membrane protein assembly factor BamB
MVVKILMVLIALSNNPNTTTLFQNSPDLLLQIDRYFTITAERTAVYHNSTMNPEQLILVGVRHSVSAVSRSNGSVLWTTKLPGGIGGDFVTVACDGERIFAHSGGKLYRLDLSTGRILWTNELRGFGYGLASICVPGTSSSPDLAAIRTIEAQQEASSSAAAAS